MHRSTLFVLLLICLGACTHAPPANVVLIIVDDLGWKDTGVYGSTFYKTPNIDTLAAEGIRFTQFYAASSVCSPTRASLMTGRHPARLQITNWIGGSQNALLRQAEYQRQLPLSEVTLGDAFSGAGYTTGYLGKWHLGAAGFRAGDQGFGYVQASNDAGQPGSYFAPYQNPRFEISNVPDLESDTDSTYLTDRLTDLAIAYIEQNQNQPFLLVLSYYNVHTPLEAKPDLIKRFESPTQGETPFSPESYGAMTRDAQDHATYAGMIASVDENIGRLMSTLRSLNLTDQTTVAFTSDNGGLSTLSNERTWAPTSNRPMRAGKGWLYEGGIRIPLIIRTGDVTAGTNTTMGTTDDLMPTLLHFAGIPAPDSLDGMNILDDAASERPLFWHFPHYHGSGNRPSGAIRSGHYKLIEWFEDGDTELYDLSSDPEETSDISQDYPGITDSLRAMLHDWRIDVQARMPTPNPDYAPPTSR